MINSLGGNDALKSSDNASSISGYNNGISLFILGGFMLSLRVFRMARRVGFEHPISRIGCVIGCIYLVNAVFFYIVEGNIEGALKRFGIPIGMLIICERLLGAELRDVGRLDQPSAGEQLEAMKSQNVVADNRR